MNKYGINNFSFEIIEECKYEDIDEREKYWIKELNAIEPYGYNICKGGSHLYAEDNPFYGKHHTKETKRLISEKLSGRKIPEEEKEIRRQINKGENNPFYGKHHTDETKEKIRKTNLERGNYEKLSERMKLNNPNDGSLFSKIILMIDDNFNVLHVFSSGKEAGEYIKEKKLSEARFPANSIYDVCRGIQKSAYGYKWKYYHPLLKVNMSMFTPGIEKIKTLNLKRRINEV